MKLRKAVHIKKEKVFFDKELEHKKVTQEDLRKSARKTEQRIMTHSKNRNSVKFVEME